MSLKGNKCIGILREVKNKWERRVSLIPKHVKELTKKGIRVLIQPSEKRIYKDSQYIEAGAKITEDVTSASLIIGVKEIPPESVIPERSYLLFSHVIKAQSQSMPLLDAMLKKKVRLFDYEKITNEKGQRLVAFGGFAGIAGMITGLRGLGEHFLSKGYQTPFLFVSSSYMYPSLGEAELQIQKVRKVIASNGLPKSLGPVVFTFTGFGNVTKGALSIFQHLPMEMVTTNDLPKLKENWDTKKVYGCVVKAKHMVMKNDGGKFDQTEFYSHPERYTPIFHEKIAPYTTILVNGMYWDPRYPRLLNDTQILEIQQNNPNSLQALFDITCDIEGSVECLKKSTVPEDPFYTFDPISNSVKNGIDGEGIMILGVDMLPAELPKEASKHFSKHLLSFISQLSLSDGSVKFEYQSDLPPELARACITSNGELTPNFQYIKALRRQTMDAGLSKKSPEVVIRIDGHLFDTGLINQILDLIEAKKGEFQVLDIQSRVNVGKLQRATRTILSVQHENEENLNKLIVELETLCRLVSKAEGKITKLPHGAKMISQSKKVTKLRDVLVLGSGFVVDPVLNYLEKKGNHITLISADLNQAQILAKPYKQVDTIKLDATKDIKLIEEQIAKTDIVVSLLPQFLHVSIAKLCCKYRKNLVTASYTSNEMKELHDQAQYSGVTILNEVGLDPGLDHMSAIKIIEEIKQAGCHLLDFMSNCGGLPSPEAVDNPLGYKFSWNPLGVLLASQNPARFLQNGQVIEVPGNELLLHNRPLIPNPMPVIGLEHIPNRDSLNYLMEYNIPDVNGIYRGTIRYDGFCNILEGFRLIGLLDREKRYITSMNWPRFLNELLQGEKLEERLSKTLNEDQIQTVLNSFNWLEMFDSKKEIQTAESPIHVLCSLLEEKLSYLPNEKDLVVLNHWFDLETSTGVRENITSSLICYGDDNNSAMSRTVGYPVAIATQQLLEGNFQDLGVITSCYPGIWKKILPECENLGIRFKELYNV